MNNLLTQKVIRNNNDFWESVRNYYLDDFLEKIYSSSKGKKLVKKWLANSQSKTILIRQVDAKDKGEIVADFLVITFGLDKPTVKIVSMNESSDADVLIESTHWGLVTGTSSFYSFISAVLSKEIRLPKLRSCPRDHFYTALLFFFS